MIVFRFQAPGVARDAMISPATAISVTASYNALPVESAPFITLEGDNQIAVYLNGGTFAETLDMSHFTLSAAATGTGFAGLTGGSVQRVSDTKALITGLAAVTSPGTGQTITVAIAGQAQLAQAASAQPDGAAAPARFVSVTAGTVPEGAAWGSTSNYARPVTIAAFKIMDSEVTYALWTEVKAWADEHSYTFANAGAGHAGAKDVSGNNAVGGDAQPVTYVSWQDALVWCNAWSEKEGLAPVYYIQGTTEENFVTGKVLRNAASDGVPNGDGVVVRDPEASGYRLPTEAEWEYAARGGAPSAEAWSYAFAGSDNADEAGWYGNNSSVNLLGNSGQETHPVRRKGANALGLYDMSGNVGEWCWDLYNYNNNTTMRVYRTGGFYWNIGPSASSSLTARGQDSNYRNGIVGFRAAMNGN